MIAGLVSVPNLVLYLIRDEFVDMGGQFSDCSLCNVPFAFFHVMLCVLYCAWMMMLMSTEYM